MLFEARAPVRTRQVSQTRGTNKPGIEVRQKLGQEGGDFEPGVRIVAF